MPTPRICLHMIVKDEAVILPRCLASVREHIDHYIVCDTGSSDGTPDVFRKELKGIPGDVHSIEFENFEQARNDALRIWHDSSPASEDEYALLLDADHELLVSDKRWKDDIAWSSAAFLRTCSLAETMSDWTIRLLHRRAHAFYEGLTHERLVTDSMNSRVDGIRIIDHGDGSSRSDKLARDVRLLARMLERNPEHWRTLYYLAQTARDMDRNVEARDLYIRASRANDVPREYAWHAIYQSALAEKELGDESAFVQGCVDAHSFRPERSESLFALARHYASTGQHSLAMKACEDGSEIPYPRNDHMRIEEICYCGGWDLIRAGSEDKKANPRRTASRVFDLSVNRSAHPIVRVHARQKCIQHVQALGSYVRGSIHEITDRIARDGFVPMNPSVALHDGKLKAILRTVNYRIGREQRGPVITENYLLTFADDLSRIEDVRSMHDLHTPRGVMSGGPVRGYEDCRLFSWNGGLWATATVLDRNREARAEIALMEISGDGTILSSLVLDPRPGKDTTDNVEPFARLTMRPKQGKPRPHEKNWCPMVDTNGAIRLLYSLDPMVALSPRLDGSCERHESTPGKMALEHLRGGSQLLCIGTGSNEWIYVTHECIARKPPLPRAYLHRFVLLRENSGSMKVISMSDPFVIIEPGIEFVSGLAPHPSDPTKLVMSFGVHDSRAFLAVLERGDVLGAARHVPACA